MSKPRSRKWGYARQCIRVYPELLMEYNMLHESLGAADMSGMPRGTGAGRKTEDIALRQMDPVDQKDFECVRSAIEKTKLLRDGTQIMEMIRLVYWSSQKYTVEGAGKRVGWAEAQAKRKHGNFVWSVINFMQSNDDTLKPKE